MDKPKESPAGDEKEEPALETVGRRTLPLWVPEALHRGARWVLSLGGRLFDVEEEE